MTSTNEHEKDWSAKVKPSARWPTVLGVLEKGCKKLPLRKLMYSCATEWSSAERKQELDNLKERFAALNRHAKRLANDLDELAEKPYYDGTGEFLRSAAHDLSSVAQELEKRKDSLAAKRSIRHTQAVLTVAPLWFYCAAATGGRITYPEVADLINAALEAESDDHATSLDGRDVRRQLEKFRERDPVNYGLLKKKMEVFVRSFPDGEVSYSEFARGLVVLPEDDLEEDQWLQATDSCPVPEV